MSQGNLRDDDILNLIRYFDDESERMAAHAIEGHTAHLIEGVNVRCKCGALMGFTKPRKPRVQILTAQEAAALRWMDPLTWEEVAP